LNVNAIGFNPGSRLLSGLSSKASPMAKGLAMQDASALNMDREQKNQDLSLKQMQDESQQRLAASRNSAQKAANASQERLGAGAAQSRASVFDVGMGFDYAALQKRRSLNLQQALLNGMARDF
jgi:hypothetical protein